CRFYANAKNQTRACLIMLSEDGQLMWMKDLADEDPSNDVVAVDGTGNVFWSMGSDAILTMRLDNTGSVLWAKRWEGGTAAACSVADSGNLLLTGTNAGGSYATYLEYTPSGTLIRELRVSDPNGSAGSGIFGVD